MTSFKTALDSDLVRGFPDLPSLILAELTKVKANSQPPTAEVAP
jgi:hypothetical protein